MGNFQQIAKGLIQQKTPTQPQEKTLAADLESVGFSRREVLSEYRQLLEDAEENNVKKGILDSIAKMHGMMQDEAQKPAPIIHINVTGDNAKVAMMLNPSLSSA